MKENPIGDPFRRACRLFLEELRVRLEEAHGFVTLVPASSDGVADVRQALRVGFHKLKGGAGFFGFAEIERISKEIERSLGSEQVLVDECAISNLKELLELLQKQFDMESRIRANGHREGA